MESLRGLPPINSEGSELNRKRFVDKAKETIPRPSSPPQSNKKIKASPIGEEMVVTGVVSPLLGFNLKNISGNLWRCIDAKEGNAGGFIYKFELNPEYKNVSDDKQKKEMVDSKRYLFFPAIEFLDDEIEGEMNVFEKKIIKENTFKEGVSFRNFKKVVEFLGYKINSEGRSKFLYLSDPKEFQSRFKQLQELMIPEARFDFNVFVSEGILDETSFVEKYNDYDVVLSSDKEFVHDNLLHLFPMLNLAFENFKEYREIKDKLISENKEIIKKINEADKKPLKIDEKIYLKIIKIGVSIRNDSLANAINIESYKKEFNMTKWPDFFGKFLLNHEKWKNYLLDQLKEMKLDLKTDDKWIVNQFSYGRGADNLCLFLKKITS